MTEEKYETREEWEEYVRHAPRTDLKLRYQHEYNSWKNGKQRAKNEGVAWAAEFEMFPEFLIAMGPKDGSDETLDRIQPGGNYSKANCRWADKTVQSENRRNVRLVSHAGEMMTVAEKARRTSLPASALYRQRFASLAEEPGYTEAELLHPWPEAKRSAWEAAFRKYGMRGEAPVKFYLRIAREKLNEVGRQYLGDDINQTVDDLPEALRQKALEEEGKWQAAIRDATNKCAIYHQMLLAKEQREKAKEARGRQKRETAGVGDSDFIA